MKASALIGLLLLLFSCLAFGDVRVKGYFRKDGTYVAPHYRSSPNSTKADNWSTKGNVNPYTGEVGTKPLEDESSLPAVIPTVADGSGNVAESITGDVGLLSAQEDDVQISERELIIRLIAAVENLDSRVEALEREIGELSPTSEPNRLLKTEERPQDNLGAWRSISARMPLKRVREILGEPKKRSVNSSLEYWYFGGGGNIVFYNGYVSAVNEPQLNEK